MLNNLPLDSMFVLDEMDVFVGRMLVGNDPKPSFTARLSNLIDSVIAINKTFCKNRDFGQIRG